MQESAPHANAENNLRVLQVSYWLCRDGGGGIQTYLATLHRALNPQPIALTYAALMPGAAPVYLDANASRNVYTGTQGAHTFNNMRRLWQWLNKQLYTTDIVHIHGVLSANFALTALACRRANVPYIVSTHGSLAPDFLKPRGWLASLYLAMLGKPLLRGAACLLATSDGEADAIGEFDPRLSIQVIPPGIEVDAVLTSRAERSCDLRVVFVGRLAPIKALPDLLAAIAKLRNDGVDAHLDIVGSGTIMADLQTDIARLKIQNAVQLHGYVTGQKKLNIIRRADVFALPSHSESFGFAAVEAMALGIPAVVSEAVGLADTITAQACGSVVPVRDADALARALVMYKNTNRRQQASERAHTCAQRHFSLVTMGVRLAALYQETAHAYRGGETAS